MAINYFAQSEKYRPTEIKTLLIGEAPPPSGKRYFYLPQACSTARRIEFDTSMSATVFHHFFQTRPQSAGEYEALLIRIRDMGIFLMDICDEPIRVRGSADGLARIVQDILQLRAKLAYRHIDVPEDHMTFLLARTNYRAVIRREFPKAACIRWKDFRMSRVL